MNSDPHFTPTPPPSTPTGIHPGHPPQPGLPPIQPPSARFIVSLFMIPGMMIFVLVLLYLSWQWLFRGPATPEEFIKGLDDPNAEVRWRTAADLSQVLPRDEDLRSNPGFALDLSDRLSLAMRRIESLERSRLERIRSAPESADEDTKSINDERQFLSFLTACSGTFVVPCGAPLLSKLAEKDELARKDNAMIDADTVRRLRARESDGTKLTSAERELVRQFDEYQARRRAAVWALAILGDNVQKFNKLAPEKQQAILNQLKIEASESDKNRSERSQLASTHNALSAAVIAELKKNRSERAQLALTQLESQKPGKPLTMPEVATALIECAKADDAFLRKQVALALTFWDGPQAEPTLLLLLNDSGRGSDNAELRKIDARDIRYNAALSLANRGSDQAAQGFDTLKEMLDLEKQKGQQQNPVDVVIATLKAVAQLKQKNPRINLSSLRPAIDQLADNNNAAVSNEAKKTQLALGQ